MDYKLIDLKAIDVITVKADSFPDGLNDAFNKLEGKLSSLKGRKFYGITLSKPEGIEYRACMVPLDDKENTALKLEPYTIPGGKYCRTVMNDWENKTGEIKNVFNKLAESIEIDNSRPQIEFYKSQKELILFLPAI